MPATVRQVCGIPAQVSLPTDRRPSHAVVHSGGAFGNCRDGCGALIRDTTLELTATRLYRRRRGRSSFPDRVTLSASPAGPRSRRSRLMGSGRRCSSFAFVIGRFLCLRPSGFVRCLPGRPSSPAPNGARPRSSSRLLETVMRSAGEVALNPAQGTFTLHLFPNRRLRYLTLVWRSGPCLPSPRRDPLCDRRCAGSGTGAARFGPSCLRHGTPGRLRNRHRDALSTPRRSASHSEESAVRAFSPSPAPCQAYDGRSGPDHALPPRGPFRISADTRDRTSSKNAQHARISVSSRSSSSLDMACRSMPENTNEIPQKSVEPVPG